MSHIKIYNLLETNSIVNRKYHKNKYAENITLSGINTKNGRRSSIK